jgi:hypothetical protein
VEDVTTAAAARVLLRDIGKLVGNARMHVESVMWQKSRGIREEEQSGPLAGPPLLVQFCGNF